MSPEQEKEIRAIMYRRWMCAPLFLIVVMTTIFGASVASATSISDWNTGSGSIFYAKTLPDGSQVDLVLEDIVKIKESYIVVAEPFRAQDRLVILTVPDSELRLWQVIECSGTLTTLPTGERALQNVTILGYASGDTGELLYHPNIIKAFPGGEQITWPWMIDLTVSDVVETASSASTSDRSEIPNSDPAEVPTFYPKIGNSLSVQSSHSQGISAQSYYDSIPDLVGLAADSLVELQCKRITGVGTETINSVQYKYLDIAEDLPAIDTIRCYYSAGAPTINNRVNKVTGQIQYTNGGTTEVICIDDGPDYDPQILVGRLSIVNSNTIPYVWSQADSASASLTGKVVTANQTDFPGSIYIQEPSSSGSFGGIRVSYSGSTIARGSLVSVTGTVALDSDGERKISNASVTVTDTGTVPGALGMPNKILGGGDFNVYTPGISYPTESGTGLYNKGLLVKSWGKVTAVDATNKFFYIDDGTGFQDGSGNTGIRISWYWPTSGKTTIKPPQIGWYVSVIGISSSQNLNSNLIRVLRPRSQGDIAIHDPDDSTLPVVTITNPPDGEMHKDRNTTNVVFNGTAEDEDTGIVSVEISIISGLNAPKPSHPWSKANYYSSTHVWNLGKTISAGAYTIWVSATDYSGNISEISRNVTISDVDVIYVSPNGNDTTGTSWGTAKKTVTAGISTASSGKEIWVAATKYIESATIQLKSGTALYGGFVGSSENVREQRDWITNKTILDGNDTKRVVSGASGTTAENCIIDGFIIQNGRASTGAGLYFSSNAATVSHNIIRLNNSLKTSSGKGAGIYCSNASPMIANNWIVGNEVIAYSGTDPGGAIYLNNSNATIVNNTIAHNSAVRAGAIYITGSSYSPTITNNIIALNSSGIYMSSGTPSITYNDVWGNSNDESDPLYWKLGNPETNHNISADPLMVYSSLGDLRIKLDSPCKDTGLDTVTLPDSLDINRNNRRNGLIDMGANEWTTADPIPTPL